MSRQQRPCARANAIPSLSTTHLGHGHGLPSFSCHLANVGIENHLDFCHLKSENHLVSCQPEVTPCGLRTVKIPESTNQPTLCFGQCGTVPAFRTADYRETLNVRVCLLSLTLHVCRLKTCVSMQMWFLSGCLYSAMSLTCVREWHFVRTCLILL